MVWWESSAQKRQMGRARGMSLEEIEAEEDLLQVANLKRVLRRQASMNSLQDKQKT